MDGVVEGALWAGEVSGDGEKVGVAGVGEDDDGQHLEDRQVDLCEYQRAFGLGVADEVVDDDDHDEAEYAQHRDEGGEVEGAHLLDEGEREEDEDGYHPNHEGSTRPEIFDPVVYRFIHPIQEGCQNQISYDDHIANHRTKAKHNHTDLCLYHYKN